MDPAREPEDRPFPNEEGRNTRQDSLEIPVMVRALEVVLGGLAQRIAMSGDGIALISSRGLVGSDGWVDFVR